MKNIDKEMINNKVNELVFIENHKRYILKCDLEKLEENIRECVLNYISDKNIKVVDYEITKENRTSLVDEYDYGYVSGYEIGHLDMPVFAKLEYNDNGDLIYEDYSFLIDFIDEHIIPTNIYKDEKKDIYYIMFTSLLGYKLNEKELEFTLKYLKSKNIYVTGQSIRFDYEYFNFSSKGNSSIISFNDAVDVDKIMDKLTIYQDNHNIDLRNEIIELSINMVKTIVHKIKDNFNYSTISSEDLESYGYLGLINVIEKYDVNSDYRFSTYAYASIKRTIIREVGASLGTDVNVYNAYYNARIFLKKELGEDFDNDILVRIEKIVDFMTKFKYLKEYRKERLKKIVMLLYCNSLDSYIDKINNCDDYIESDYNLLDDNFMYLTVTKNVIKNKLESILENLSENDVKILIEHYGLKGNDLKTLNEIGEDLGLTRQRIHSMEKSIFNNLKKSDDGQYLKDFIEEYDQYNYHNNPLIAYQNVKKK